MKSDAALGLAFSVIIVSLAIIACCWALWKARTYVPRKAWIHYRNRDNVLPVSERRHKYRRVGGNHVRTKVREPRRVPAGPRRQEGRHLEPARHVRFEEDPTVRWALQETSISSDMGSRPGVRVREETAYGGLYELGEMDEGVQMTKHKRSSRAQRGRAGRGRDESRDPTVHNWVRSVRDEAPSPPQVRTPSTDPKPRGPRDSDPKGVI